MDAFPLLTASAPTVRCHGIRANGHACGRLLRDAESVARGIGPDCAERAGLVSPRRPRFPAVSSGAAEGPNLMDLINEGETTLSYTAACDHDYTPTFGGPRPRIVTLCGSTRFKEAFETAEREETLAGRIVITVGLFGHVEGLDMGTDEEPSDTKAMLDELHKRKIDLADEILVCSDTSGYHGKSTRSEIEYARAAGKPVRFYRQPA